MQASSSNAWFSVVSRFFPLAGCTAGPRKEAPAKVVDCASRFEPEWEAASGLGPGSVCKPLQRGDVEAVQGQGVDCGKPRRETEWEARIRSEDALWDTQLKSQASIGRIVEYEAHEQPCQDLILRGGAGQRIRVQAVCQNGKAAIAGVKCGDVLVSVNGDKDFAVKPLEQFYQSLPKPAVLVFIGLLNCSCSAELRIKRKEIPCGLPSRLLQFPAIGSRDPKDFKELPLVVEEVIFETAMVPD